MGGFNLVSQGATSAVDPSKAAAMKRKQLRDVMRNNQREWTEAKVRQGKYLEPAFYKKVIKEKGPIKLLHSNIKIEPRPALFPKHLDFNMLKISTLNLPVNKRLFGFDPVDLVGGGYMFNRREPLFPSHAPIEWAWNWNSQSEYTGSLGNKIQFSFDAHLIYSKEDMRFCYNDLEGRKMLVPYLETGKTYYHEPFYLRFERSEDGWLIYHLETQVYCFFKEQQTPDVYRLAKAWKGIEEYTLDYDSEDRLSQISDNHQHQWKIDYNDRNLIQQVTREGTRLVSYEYDSLGNLTKVTNQAGHSMDFYYQEYLLTRRKDECNYSFFWQYDKEDRVIRTWGEGHVLEGSLTYNDEELYTLTTDGLGSETQYFYNNQGIVTQIDYGDDTTEFFEYDKEERLIKMVHRDGKISQYEYDELGFVCQYEDSSGKRFTRTYDKDGRCLSDFDGKLLTSYTYNDQGKLKSISNHQGPQVCKEYDENGFLQKQTKDGQETFYFYENQPVDFEGLDTVIILDSFGQMKEYHHLDNRYQFEYDASFQLTRITLNGTEYLTVTYDAKHRVTELQYEGHTHHWTYNGLDHVIKESDDSGVLEYDYNTNGQVKRIKHNGMPIRTLTRDSNGKIIVQEMEDGLKISYAYDQEGRVGGIENQDERILFRYDEKGNVFEKYFSDGTWEFYDFDQEGRMIHGKNNFSEVSLEYDEKGNLLEERLIIEKGEQEDSVQMKLTYEDGLLAEITINDELIQVNEQLNSMQVENRLLINETILKREKYGQEKEIISIPKLLTMENEGNSEKRATKITWFDTDVIEYDFIKHRENKNSKHKFSVDEKAKKLRDKQKEILLQNKRATEAPLYSYMHSTILTDTGVCVYDSLGRIFAELKEKQAKRYIWVKEELYYTETINLLTQESEIEQYHFFPTQAIILHSLENQYDYIEIYDYETNKVEMVNMDGSKKREDVKENSATICQQVKSYSKAKKIKNDEWYSNINQQDLFCTSKDIEELLNQTISNLIFQ